MGKTVAMKVAKRNGREVLIAYHIKGKKRRPKYQIEIDGKTAKEVKELVAEQEPNLKRSPG